MKRHRVNQVLSQAESQVPNQAESRQGIQVLSLLPNLVAILQANLARNQAAIQVKSHRANQV